MSNLTQRILTALIGAPLVLGAVFLGGWYLAVVVLVVALACQYETYALFEAINVRPLVGVGLAIGGLVVVRPLVPPAMAGVLLGVVGVVAWTALARTDVSLHALAATLLGLLYPTALLSTLLDVRLGRGIVVGDREAFWLLLTLFLLIWATDIMAYVVGKNFGRHKLAPQISPKKTWEGAGGGALGAVAVAAGLKLTVLSFVAWGHVVALALICGVFSQVGDLAESRMKRAVGVKDSGTWLPGHGGFLDRFDAMILAAPVYFIYLRYVANLFDGAAP